MQAPVPKPLPCFGFLTVLHDQDVGFQGGYLVLNALGRPLEFHCTSPILPNRAQEILYGPTLKPFLYGEHIGRTLAEKAKQSPALIFTDVEPALCLRDFVKTPVLWVRESSGNPTTEASIGDKASRRADFQLGDVAVSTLKQHTNDQKHALDFWQANQHGLDLSEPFGRIREALCEAQAGARNAAA